MENKNLKKQVENMQSRYRLWLDNQNAEQLENKMIENKLIEIAKDFKLSFTKKIPYVLIFEHGIVAWHNDHDASHGIDETGFDYDIDEEFLIE